MAASYIYILSRKDPAGTTTILSAHATEKSANDAATSIEDGSDFAVDRIVLIGGTVVTSKPPTPTTTTTTAADRSRSLLAHAKFEKKEKDAAAPLPTPKADALAGQTLVFTGELARMTRKQAQGLARAAGARTVTAVSRKCTLVVLGRDAGPKKLEQIEEFGIEVVEEEGFLDLVKGCGGGGGGGGTKRAAEEDGEEGADVGGVKEEEEEEEKEVVEAPRKRTRRARA